MRIALARTVSILGHPLLLLPAASLALAAAGGAPRTQLWLLGSVLGALAILIQAWSWRQVRRGRWQHVDASQRGERKGLNRFLLGLLLLTTLGVSLVHPLPALAWGLGCAAGMVAAGMVLARWLKLSLHVAFAVFSAALLAGLGPVALAAASALAVAVAWSRWVLGRHRPRELLAGAAIGALAAGVFWSQAPGGA
jgi:hypothetical protein